MRFYCTATNSRGTSIGTAGGGRIQEIHARTWTHGVKIVARDTKNMGEVFFIMKTEGSNNLDAADECIGIVYLEDDVPKFSNEPFQFDMKF